MRKTIISLFALLYVATIYAEDYKILQMNTPSVKIGSRECVKGDVFSDDSIIVWAKEKQAIKAQNLATKKIQLFTEPSFRAHSSTTIKEYFFKKNHMSSRGCLSLSELSEQLNNTFYLFDTIRIESPIPIDSTKCYYMHYHHNNHLIEKVLPSTGDEFLIVRSDLEIGDSTIYNDITIQLYFRSDQVEDDYLLTDSMKITLIPLE